MTTLDIWLLLAFYVFQAAASSLPEQNFKFYPWFRHTVQLLCNAVPYKYNLPKEQKPPNTGGTNGNVA